MRDVQDSGCGVRVQVPRFVRDRQVRTGGIRGIQDRRRGILQRIEVRAVTSIAPPRT